MGKEWSLRLEESELSPGLFLSSSPSPRLDTQSIQAGEAEVAISPSPPSFFPQTPRGEENSTVAQALGKQVLKKPLL